MLGALTIAAAQRLSGDTPMVQEDNSVRKPLMARVNDVVLLDHPVDTTGARCINCYFVEVQDFAAPPDLELLLLQDAPQHWVNPANLTLLGELRRRAEIIRPPRRLRA